MTRILTVRAFRLVPGTTLALGLFASGCASSDSDAGDSTESGAAADEGAGEDEAAAEDSGGADEAADESDPTEGGGGSQGADEGEDEGADESGAGFILEPDGGGQIECDIWAQDCPEGQKCMPWANDGSGSWNATRCSPLDGVPNQPGDECSTEGGGVSGIDDCDVASMCWNVGEDNVGVCVGFCEGSQASPACSDPDTGCSITNDGVLALCLPFCDPLLQDCSDGEACYPETNGFFCSPDASGENGGYGDPCAFLNVCDPGLWCGDASAVPGCTAEGCCSEFCDITEETNQCSGEAGGQECVAYYTEGNAPPGYEDVGVCTIPQ